MNTGNAAQGYYADTAPASPERPLLAGSMCCDVCIVGAGLTGLSAALYLAKAGAQVVLLEANSPGYAASGRNGGQIHIGYRREQAELEHWLGNGHAHDLWDLAEAARNLIPSLLRTHNIDCDFRPGIFLAAHSDIALRALAADGEHLERNYGHATKILDAEQTAALLGTKKYHGGRLGEQGGHLHPLKFSRGLAKAAEQYGVLIHENTPARTIDAKGGLVRIRCDAGVITADRVILACDAFSGTLIPELSRYIGHIEGFQVATAPLAPVLNKIILPSDIAVADTRFAPDYYKKTADGRLVFGGGERYWSMPRNNAQPVWSRLQAVYPQLAQTRIDYAWRGTIGVTRTRMPHLGKISEHIFFAHGYSGQGLVLSLAYGKAMAEAAMGQNQAFDILARVPAKPFPGNAAMRKPLMAAGLLFHKMLDAF